MSTLRIDTLGTLFFIESEADSEYLENLLVNYKNMVTLVEKSSAGTVTEPLQVAILSGIMLCDELFKEKQKTARLAKDSPNPDDLYEVERRTLEMIRKIETVLSPTLAEAPESPTLAEAPESQTLVEASKSQTADAGGGAKSDDYLA